MKIKEQTIKALDSLSESELMLVNEWIDQLKSSHKPQEPKGKYHISYEQLHQATSKCKTSFSSEISSEREDRL